MNAENIAVFIDFENFGQQEIFDARALIESLKEKGRLVIKKAYAAWGRYARYKRQMLENSIELTELPSHGKRGKNSADIKLVVDALETAIIRDYVDTIIVVSGDSDYTPLISKIREYNKKVIVVGIRQNMSSLLKGYCDELIYYSTLVGQQEYAEEDIATTWDLLARTVSLMEKNGVETRGSQIKSMMRQLDSAFDESNYGYSQFKKYLKAAEGAGIVKLRDMHTGGDVIVALSDGNDKQPPEAFSPGNSFSSVLAELRKRGMQFVGRDMQGTILSEIHDKLTDNDEGLFLRNDIMNKIFEGDLKPYLDNETLSKSKINGVFKIPYLCGALELVKKDEESPILMRLFEEYESYDKFREIHDSAFVYFAKKHNVPLEEVAEQLYGDKEKVDYLNGISLLPAERKFESKRIVNGNF